jgi:hypothetical protein
MPNVKISDLLESTVVADGDLLPIVDVSDTTQGAEGSTKYIKYENIKTNLINLAILLALALGKATPAVADSILLIDSEDEGAVKQLYFDDLLAMVKTVSNMETQAVELAAAASGSNGIQVKDNINIDFGATSFSIHIKAQLPDYTPAANVLLAQKLTASVGYQLEVVATTGVLRLTLNTTVYNSSVAPSFVDGMSHKITVVVTVGAVNTTVDFICDGVVLGAQVSAVNPGSVSNAAVLYFLGTSSTRSAGVLSEAYLFNFALTTAEALSLHRNGIKACWQWGDQTALTSGTLITDKEYFIDTYVSDDDFANIGGANQTGARFVVTGTTPTHWAHSSSLRQVGACFALHNEGVQPPPGQWFDSSSNKNHALLPLAGACLMRRMKNFEIRWTNSWTNTHEPQNLGGVAQAILATGAFITSIIGVVSGADVQDIVLGDGSTVDRFVTITTDLAAETKVFAIANPISDGTNNQLVVDPDTNATMAIAWTITGLILQ